MSYKNTQGLVGPQGDTGPQGPQGDTGPQGPPGAVYYIPVEIPSKITNVGRICCQVIEEPKIQTATISREYRAGQSRY